MTRPLATDVELHRTRLIKGARAEGLDVAAINELLSAAGYGPADLLAAPGNLWTDVQAHARRLRIVEDNAA